jgi:hypothetical protein
MKTTAKLLAICLMMASLGFAQDTKKADDTKGAAATDTKKDDGMAKKKGGKKGGKKGKKGAKGDGMAAPAASPDATKK